MARTSKSDLAREAKARASGGRTTPDQADRNKKRKRHPLDKVMPGSKYDKYKGLRKSHPDNRKEGGGGASANRNI